MSSEAIKQEQSAAEFSFDTIYDLLILGGGPAGLNAAIYAKRKGLNPAILSERLGGQILDTSEIDNYLGLPGVTGFELANKYIEHARSLDIPMLEGAYVTDYQRSENPNMAGMDAIHELILSDGQVARGYTILLATGSKPRHLNIPGEEKLNGSGVSYCAICDGFFFRNKPVVIAGGGNAALEAAIDMAKISSEVTIIQRSSYRADQVLLDIADAQPNIKRIDQSQILEILGQFTVEGVRVLDKRTNEIYDYPTNAVFVEIGHIPTVGPFVGKLDRNENGEVIIDDSFRTSIPGVYAAGDVTTEPFKQIIVAAAQGASAALVINQDFNHMAGTSSDHNMQASVTVR